MQILPQSDAPIESPAATQAAKDSALIRRFLSGDEAAFVSIMTFYRGRLFNLAFRHLRNHGDAEEIVQDTFVRAHRNLANFRGDSSLATWLYHIALNLSRNRHAYFFRRKRGSTLSLDCPIGDVAGASSLGEIISHQAPDPAHMAACQDSIALIVSCTKKLDFSHGEILEQRILQDRSYDEIGEALGLKAGTVKSRLARARRHLRLSLIEACPEFGAAPESSAWFAPYREQSGFGGSAALATA